MNSKEIEGAKQLIEIPDVKAGSYSFIGDSDVTYADIRILLDYIKDLEQENQKYKEVIDKAKEWTKKKINNCTIEANATTTDTMCRITIVGLNHLLDILKEVK